MEAVSLPAHRRATYEDLLAMPDHLVVELIDGEIYAMPRPRILHAGASSVIGVDVGGAFGKRKRGAGPGGWIILDEPELHLGPGAPTDLVLVPDLAGWRRTRLPELPDIAAFELAPDWICEVLSPSTANHDRIRKMEWYGRAGVKWAWLVDPTLRSVEVYEHDGVGWRFHGGVDGEGMARIRPFDAVEFDLSEWWGAPVVVEPAVGPDGP